MPTPDEAKVRSIVRGVISNRKADEGWLCGADLEAAFNSAFRRKAREATRGVRPIDPDADGDVEVIL